MSKIFSLDSSGIGSINYRPVFPFCSIKIQACMDEDVRLIVY